MQFDDLGAGLRAELRVEVGQRLVHEEHLGAAHDRPGERNPLALPTREGPGLAFEVVAQAEDVGGLADPAFPLGGVDPPTLVRHERRFDVLSHRHVGVEGVALEDHRDVAIGRRDVVDDPVADRQRSAGDGLEARDHPKRRGLAATGGTEEHHELLVVDRQVEAVDCDGAIEDLADMVEDDATHSDPPWCGANPSQPEATNTVSTASMNAPSTNSERSSTKSVTPR